MAEILHTNFAYEQERHEPSVGFDAPYAILEPDVYGVDTVGSEVRLNASEVLAEMQAFADELTDTLWFRYSVDMQLGGSGAASSLRDVLDSHGSVLFSGSGWPADTRAACGIVTSMARLAERSGFDPDKAIMGGLFTFGQKVDASHELHADGLNGMIYKDTTNARMIRCVYALGPGTLIYPRLQTDDYVLTWDEAGTGVIPVRNPSRLEILNGARGANATPKELEAADAQQVLPGKILAFDPTRKFWHHAPPQLRPSLRVGIRQAD